MSKQDATGPRAIEQRYVALIIIVLAIAVFIFTYIGIKESRADSMKLLVLQGKAFVESLTEAANNAIESERFFDYLVHKWYSEIVVGITQQELGTVTDGQLIELANSHSLYGVYVYASDTIPIAGGIVRGPIMRPPDYVIDEVRQIMANPENNYVLLLDVGDSPEETVHYYIEISNSLDRVVLLIADAAYYVDAMSQTQIGYLAQKMAGAPGVEYIIYQSTEGIIFSSRRTASLLAIESDPFLTDALNSDSVAHREYEFEDTEVLEMVRPFSTATYPFGLLRVGLSLQNYRSVTRGFDRQMIALSAMLLVLVVVAVLYLNARKRRTEIARQYREIKSISDRIFDQMRTGVAAIDSAGRVMMANGAFESILGISGAPGKTWDKLLEEDRLRFDNVMNSAEPTLEHEIEYSRSGDRRWLLVALSKTALNPGEPSGMVAVVYDITRLKDLERKSARRERLSEMGNLAAGVAHEIRNPLNTISIAAQRLAGEFAPAENSEEYLSFTRQIREETKRLNEIITRFLALAHEERDRLKQIELKPFIDDFVKLVEYEARSLEIKLNVEVQPAAKITADPDKLKQVLSNLFNNSKEALGSDGGEIYIVGETAGKGEVVLRFGDSGPGIPKEMREKVFTPFYTTKDSGTGLGLPTIYRIITGMGGDIRIESGKLGGAEFVMTFSA